MRRGRSSNTQIERGTPGRSGPRKSVVGKKKSLEVLRVHAYCFLIGFISDLLLIAHYRLSGRNTADHLFAVISGSPLFFSLPRSGRISSRMAQQSWLRGVIKEVPSGDTLVIIGAIKSGIPPEKRIILSSLVAPKLVRL
jgi:hypothetical protein